MLKFLIVDDEPLAHEIIEEFSSMIPHISKAGNCYSAMEAMQFLNEHTVDFMFLDINMPKLKGLDFLKTMSNPPKTIITTAYKEHALEGFELSVTDYILKPFSFDRFVKAVQKVTVQNTPKTTNQSVSPPAESKNRIFVKGDKKHVQIALDEILYVEAYGNYSKLYTFDEMILCHEKISHFESLLNNGNFLRVHKSFLVAKNKIKSIEGNRIFILDYKIPIGQTYRSTINKLLG